MAAAPSVAVAAVDPLNRVSEILKKQRDLTRREDGHFVQEYSTIEKIFDIAHDTIEITEANFLPWRKDVYKAPYKEMPSGQISSDTDVVIPAEDMGNKPFVWGYSNNDCPFIAIQCEVRAEDQNGNSDRYRAILTIFQRYTNNGACVSQSGAKGFGSHFLSREFLEILLSGKAIVEKAFLREEDFLQFQNLDPSTIVAREVSLLKPNA